MLDERRRTRNVLRLSLASFGPHSLRVRPSLFPLDGLSLASIYRRTSAVVATRNFSIASITSLFLKRRLRPNL